MLNNRKFIEAFLVGMNYEMGRELLWREYPTDQRGSYFRQFWDANNLITPATTTTDTEKQKDITRIQTWATGSLGTHKPPSFSTTAGGKDTLILVIRGDLLRKYPNTIVFAQKAQKKSGGGGGGQQNNNWNLALKSCFHPIRQK